MTDDWSKHAARLRELARDPAVRAYLLGRLCAESSADDLADLVEAALVYRERFGAAGNYRRSTPDETLSALRFAESAAFTRARREVAAAQELPDL